MTPTKEKKTTATQEDQPITPQSFDDIYQAVALISDAYKSS